HDPEQHGRMAAHRAGGLAWRVPAVRRRHDLDDRERRREGDPAVLPRPPLGGPLDGRQLPARLGFDQPGVRGRQHRHVHLGFRPVHRPRARLLARPRRLRPHHHPHGGRRQGARRRRHRGAPAVARRRDEGCRGQVGRLVLHAEAAERGCRCRGRQGARRLRSGRRNARAAGARPGHLRGVAHLDRAVRERAARADAGLHRPHLRADPGGRAEEPHAGDLRPARPGGAGGADRRERRHRRSPRPGRHRRPGPAGLTAGGRRGCVSGGPLTSHTRRSSATSQDRNPKMTALDERRASPQRPRPRPAAVPAPRRRDRSLRGWVRRGGLVTLLFAAPMIFVFTVYSWWPILQSLWMSFQKTNLITYQFVGLDNFVNVLTDPVLGRAVVNTLYFALLALIFGFPLPIFMAVLMSEVKRLKGFYSALAYLPVVVPPVVAVLLWQFFYSASPTGV